MTSWPINTVEDELNENISEDALENNNSFNYNENLTAKLGGNYAKIIEFYDSRL
jgi:hypothetical protein